MEFGVEVENWMGKMVAVNKSMVLKYCSIFPLSRFIGITLKVCSCKVLSWVFPSP